VGAVEPVATDAEAPAEPLARDRRILIVDDEPEIRDTLAEILGTEQHAVVTVESGRDALERLAAEPFDVVLTDIRMPDLDGPALYEEIERRWPGKGGLVIFVTGDTLTSASRDFVAASGRPLIEKPFLPSEVRRWWWRRSGTPSDG
jgi:two-component system NtrC family sensor kinase